MGTRGRHGMTQESVIARLSTLSVHSCGAFRGEAANAAGVSATQLARLAHEGAIERVLPHTYRMVAYHHRRSSGGTRPSCGRATRLRLRVVQRQSATDSKAFEHPGPRSSYPIGPALARRSRRCTTATHAPS